MPLKGLNLWLCLGTMLMDLLHKFLVWRIKHVSDRTFLLILGIIVGILSGVAASILKTAVHLIERLLTSDMTPDNTGFWQSVYPIIGIVLTVILAHYVLNEKLGHGITAVLYRISKRSSIISRKKTYNRLITSALTVGFGGSVGLEAPIVLTGSAIGSNMGRLTHMNYRKRTLLIGCGAAGAISAIFASPVAGVIFAIEVLLPEVTIAMFIPILISSVFGSLTSNALVGEGILFKFTLIDQIELKDYPVIAVLGLVAGLASVYFSRVTLFAERWLGKQKNFLLRAALGGLGVGVLILFMNPLYGEGYTTIRNILTGHEIGIFQNNYLFGQDATGVALIGLMAMMLLMKPLATGFTIGAGGSGGIFAPSLFMGAILGFVFASVLNMVFGVGTASASNFTLIGMSGVMSGVLHAPLTAIFLIAEITQGYTLFVPLMLVSAIAYSTASIFESHSIYEKQLAETGDLLPRDKDKLVLSVINLNKIVETDLLKIHPEASLGELVKLVRQSKRNIFPVVNDEGELKGIVTLDDIRGIMFEKDSYDSIKVNELMHMPPTSVTTHENMQSVMSKFEQTNAWNLPVINEGKYVGFISKSRIFNTYRNKLRRQQST